MERESDERHWYLDGEIYAMSGESLQHSQICVNLIGDVRSQLKGTDCQALSPNMKVRTGDSGLFSYPDLSVVCGTPLFHDKRKDVLLNPVVIFEVLSPSTVWYDRGAKFFRYQTFLPSLLDYVLVWQDQPAVELFSRWEDGNWFYTPVQGLSAKMTIPSINCVLELSEIYSRVTFPPQELASQNT